MQIKEVLRQYLLTHHFGNRDAGELTDTTPLFTYGILDSIAIMQLLTYLEAEFDIEFGPRDLDRRGLDTMDQIERLVARKLEERADAAGNRAVRE